jgi:hypothetical protein
MLRFVLIHCAALQITNEQLLAAVIRPRSDPIAGFQAYIPNEEDLTQWDKLRHHLLTPEEAERDPEVIPWEVGCKKLNCRA